MERIHEAARKKKPGRHEAATANCSLWQESTKEMERESREIFGLKLQALVDRRDIYFFVFTIYILSLQKSVSSLNA